MTGKTPTDRASCWILSPLLAAMMVTLCAIGAGSFASHNLGPMIFRLVTGAGVFILSSLAIYEEIRREELFNENNSTATSGYGLLAVIALVIVIISSFQLFF